MFDFIDAIKEPLKTVILMVITFVLAAAGLWLPLLPSILKRRKS